MDCKDVLSPPMTNPIDQDQEYYDNMHGAPRAKRTKPKKGAWANLREEDRLQIRIIKLLRSYQRRGTLQFIVAQPERLISVRTSMYMRGLLIGLGIFGNGGHVEIIVLMRGGRVMLWELKKPRGKLSADQAAWRDWATANGYSWHKPETIEQAEALVSAAAGIEYLTSTVII